MKNFLVFLTILLGFTILSSCFREEGEKIFVFKIKSFEFNTQFKDTTIIGSDTTECTITSNYTFARMDVGDATDTVMLTSHHVDSYSYEVEEINQSEFQVIFNLLEGKEVLIVALLGKEYPQELVDYLADIGMPQKN